MLQRPGLPLFLQFKLSDCMMSERAREVRLGLLTSPYYRMHLRARRHSRQHEMLHDLESSGQEVYYSAPAFYRPEELNNAYLNHRVRNRSIWVRPSMIGLLPDDGDHYLAFQLPGAIIFRSEPHKIENKADFENFSKTVQEAFRRRAKSALSKEKVLELARVMATISHEREGFAVDEKSSIWEALDTRHPIAQIGFYSQMIFDCHFFILQDTGTPSSS
jgi:hypothetical protein